MKRTATFLLAILIFVSGIFYIKGNNKNSGGGALLTASSLETGTSTDTVVPALAEKIPETIAISDNVREYKNAAFSFSLFYPKNLQVREFKERKNAMTVTFQDSETNAGFQIYVTPYSSDHIDNARFAIDQPSGVINDPLDVIIDGVRGTIFFGKNSIMGDTREVWFIRGGLLYEVTTYKQLDEWLGDIMKTWKFL